MNPKIAQIVALIEGQPEKLQEAVNMILGSAPSDAFLDGLILGLTEPKDLSKDIIDLLDMEYPNFAWADTYRVAIAGAGVAYGRSQFHGDGIDASAFASGATALFTQPEFTQMPTEMLIMMQDWFNAGQDAITSVINSRLPVSE